MIGKWINDGLVTPSVNEYQKVVIANPTEDILKYVMGYKDVIEAEKPEYDEATQCLQMIKTDETDDIISIGWEVKNIEIPAITEEVSENE